jgi:metal-sulfur cluster biosynthetic enzyme
MSENTQAETANEVAAAEMPSDDEMIQALKAVYDPELGINIVDLGLVYGLTKENGVVTVDMTLTSPACPLAPVIKVQAESVLCHKFPAVQDVEINLVWSPRWDPRTMASEEAKAELGIW